MNVLENHKMLVFTAPSGAGKTTVVRHLLQTYDQLDFSVSATTRKMRKNEKEGNDYYFLSESVFKQKIEQNAFVEWEEVYHGQYYGTLKSEVSRLWKEGKQIVFDVDVHGATRIKDLYGDACLAVFIKPPSLQILIERLKNRKSETEATLRKRITRIKKELTYEHSFDKILINDVLEVALKEAELIVEEFIFESYINF
jgi:guanylate kinase